MNEPTRPAGATTGSGEDFAEVMREWRTATEDPADAGRATDLHAHRRELGGRQVWVIEENGQVVEVTDAIETLIADHPQVHVHVDEVGTPGSDVTPTT